mgnify:CR=1 FL=1
MPTAFITGAAVGQGNMLAKKLANKGYKVFAGVLPGAETDLKSSDNITVVEQNVAEFDSVRESARVVKQALGDTPLDVVMNVAGVANIATGTIEGMNLEELDLLFRINTFGQAAVCQAFLPMVRAAGKRGKILNFGSGAVVANPPVAGSYNMSKHAVHGLTMTLRLELAPWGTQVTSIWPGAVFTGMTEGAREATEKNWVKQPQAVQDAYAPYLKEGICERLPDTIEKLGNTPDYVTDEVIKLLDKARLKPFYLIGKKDAAPLGPMAKWLPNSVFEAIIRKSYNIPAAS